MYPPAFGSMYANAGTAIAKSNKMMQIRYINLPPNTPVMRASKLVSSLHDLNIDAFITQSWKFASAQLSGLAAASY